MRIAIAGAGGVGGYFGARLAAAGEDVAFLARGRTLEALRTRGLRVESIKGDVTLDRVHASDDAASIGEVDVVLVAVKAWQVPELAAALRPLLGRDTIVIPLQNGIEAPEQLAAVLGREHVGGGLAGIVSFVVEPGHVRHAGAEPLIAFGELDNRRSDRCERLLRALQRAGVNAEVPPDIHRSMWTKFVFITPMSGIGAVSRVPVGVWRAVAETRAVAERAVREVISVANAHGITLAENAVELTMARYDGLPPESTASLQRDVIDGKPSELEAQLGAVSRMAAAAGVPAPVHDTLYAALLPLERKARNA
jgi:2-dehydropantoate 2-reductase